jgi:hypothetical protein
MQVEDRHKGALPFRAWQIYNDMVTYLRARKVREFLCAAGILAHYLGDACQPLHVSRFHHGYGFDANSTTPEHPLPPGVTVQRASKVHSVFEQEMMEGAASVELIQKIDNALQGTTLPFSDVAGGQAAGLAVVDLMERCFTALPPTEVCDTFNANIDVPNRKRRMWQLLGDRTAKCMADGALTLAAIWQAAWDDGNGDSIPSASLGPVDREDLVTLYTNREFLKAVNLEVLTESRVLRQGPLSRLVTL